MVKYYPVNLNLNGKRCLVVGGGSVAGRKVRRLLDCGAQVKLISPKISSGLKKLVKAEKIVYINRRVNLKDLSGAYLVISAVDDKKINSSVSNYCKKKNILVNVADSPSECAFILPSIVTRGDLTISISTQGVSPALSKKIRQELEKKYGPEYAKLLKAMKKLRPQVIKRLSSQKLRKAFFEKAVSGDVLSFLKKGRKEEAVKKV